MEPVHLDFIVGGNVDSEGRKVENQFSKIGKSAKEAKAEISAQIREQKELIRHIEQDIKKTEKLLAKGAFGKEKLYLESELKAMKAFLAEEKGGLEILSKKLDETAIAYERMTTKAAQARDTLAKLDAQGLRGSEQWNAVSKELEGYAESLKSVQMQSKVLADPSAGFKAVAGGVSALSGVLTAGIGAASLFGAEQEELAKIQTRLQSAMAISIGLQQVSEQLNKNNYFSIVLLSKAKQGWAKAQAFLNTQLRLGAVASKALMATGVGLLIAGIAMLVVQYDKWRKKQKEINELQKEYAELQGDIARSVADEKMRVEQLVRVANDQSRNMKLRINAVEQLNKLMPDYNGYIDEEGRLIADSNTALESYIKNLINVEKAKKIASRIADNESELEQFKNTDLDYTFLQRLHMGAAKAFTFGFGGKEVQDRYDAKLLSPYFKLTESIEKDKEALEKLLEDDKVFEKLFGDGGTPGQRNQLVSAILKEQYDAEATLQHKLLELSKQTTKLQIDQMQDGLEKRIAQIGYEEQREIERLEESQRAIVEAYNKSRADEKDFVPIEKIEEVPGVKPETLQAWADEMELITAHYEFQRVKATQDANDEIIKLANSYADERVQIALAYAEDIDKLEKAGQTEAATAAKEERDRRISDSTAEMLSTTELYKTATDEKLIISKEATEQLIEDIKKRIEAEEVAGNLSKEKARELLDELNKAGVGRSENKNAMNPFAQLIKGLDEYRKAKEKLSTAKDAGSDAAELAKLEDAANKALQSTASAAGAALMGVESILGGVVDGLDQLGLLTEEEKQTANEVIGMVGGAADLAMGIASGNPVQMIQGSIQLLVNGLKLFDKKSKDIAKEQKKRKKELEDLSEAYRKLQREASKALGSDLFKYLRESIANQKKQIDEYERLIKLEQSKKKKKQNKDDIDNWKREIELLKEGMEDTIAEIRNKLTGTDTHSMASELANALVSAFEQGEDAAEAFGKVFDDVMRNAVLNAFKMKYLEKPIDDWLNNLANYMDGGELSDWEKRMLEAERDAIFQNSKAGWDAISSMWSIDDRSIDDMGQKGQGIKGDVKNLSEETGTKLAGAINAMRLNVDEILRNNRSSIDIMSRQLATLDEIKSNTHISAKKLERMDETLYDMKVNGLKVK